MPVKDKTDEAARSSSRSRSSGDRVEREGDAGGDTGASPDGSGEGPRAARSAPPAKVPERVGRIAGSPSASVKELQVMLADLGFYTGKINGYYDTATRNATSDLQVQLREHGYYSGRPNGTFDGSTRDALMKDPAFHTA